MTLHAVPLDYLSCVLTITSTILVGKKHTSGWWVAALNSILICVIGMKSGQFGFVPANLFCLALYAMNIRTWARQRTQQTSSESDAVVPCRTSILLKPHSRHAAPALPRETIVHGILRSLPRNRAGA